MGFWDKALSAPGALLLGGVGLWGLAWGIDAWTHVEAYGIAQGAHVHGGQALIRVNMAFSGLPLVVFGMAQLVGTQALLKRGGMPLFFASLFLMLDGLAHAFAFNDHLGEPASAAFFAFAAPAQIAIGASLPFASRARDRWLALGTLGLFVLYAASRTATFGPLAWPERVEGLDVFSKAMEVFFVLAVWSVVRALPAKEGNRGGTSPEGAAAPAEGSRL